MTPLVNELLAFTKAGLRARPAELSQVELYPLVNDLITREAADARITVSIAPEVTVRTDAPMLARALSNLVRNAVRYAGDAGPIVRSAITAYGGEIHFANRLPQGLRVEIVLAAT